MGREDLPSVRAAREAEQQPLDLDGFALKVQQAFDRLYLHNRDITWLGVYNELEDRGQDVLGFLQERSTPHGRLRITLKARTSEVLQTGFPLAYYLATRTDEAFGDEIARLNEQAYDILESGKKHAHNG